MADIDREHYFDLPVSDQADVLQSLAPVMGRRAEILEKDIWLCQVLNILFQLPCRKPMAFKGGTSLSKVYKAIERFSEDIDVTVDYRSLVADAPELESIASNSQRSKLSDALKAALTRHVIEELVPALRATLASALPTHSTSIEVSDDAEKLWVFYPSAVENADSYVRPSILIEFGGRNSTLPKSTLAITPDIAEHVPDLALPTAQVSVLSAARTFWEKATLIHVECHRSSLRPSAERLSRHWYDLARLADHEVGQQALGDSDLLRDVLRIKETFYRSGFSHYDRCIAGGLRLIPDEPLLDALRQDYQAMLAAQMFYGDTLVFETIVGRLRQLEAEINSISRR
ncbi:nucleotidyl transferase AbiEii/AbiGii toxin family protein [Allochromatium humboldtianum]|uniref:Nucleotidyl transferase AbiEii/AbiGii toxin family protein n=1 Tax=Allochromatium humboldtianum TaxID=504901 RepID=A0A850RP81_9GAMM|nr:nucleotidyl transferase AbiEii/AbiGii toxin family protein [Allochromatium humboldtianum]NVZ11271.1 nucleotidyl transferase AbiEii/AbiGii toxin family protein [Allochromatium humboldtianum]